MSTSPHSLPASPTPELTALVEELRELVRTRTPLPQRAFDQILHRHPKEGKFTFSKSEIIRAFRELAPGRDWVEEEESFLARFRARPIRTQSGVAPVTVLTRPYPCPGRCIFCPSDVRSPKSYLPMEPGAQRAAHHHFDPYEQTLNRLRAFWANGHPVDKVELIVLGGTWSSYPESYQIWFLKRCFEAMNAFSAQRVTRLGPVKNGGSRVLDFSAAEGRPKDGDYNRAVRERFAADQPRIEETASWTELGEAQHHNESGEARCVGLSLETRPDHVDEQEVLRLRRLGATKIQIGYQSLSDQVLARNRRGHDVAATRRASVLLRAAGFKVQAHWMPNLLGSSPEQDIEDYQRLFDDPELRPDELKIYPCSLVEGTELMDHHRRGDWRPYTSEEILQVLSECLRMTPEYCRLTRVIRDIPSHDIVVGLKANNFREKVHDELARRGQRCRDIRSRQVLGGVEREALELREIAYTTALGSERFLQFVTADDRLAGFLRLSLPKARDCGPVELHGSAVIREIHVYGRLANIGERNPAKTQHRGLGRELVKRAREIAEHEGYPDLAVISAVGTRGYYRNLGFQDGPLYQHLSLTSPAL